MPAHFHFQRRKTSEASMLCAAVLAVDHLLWSIYGSYFAAIDQPPERAAGLLTSAIPPAELAPHANAWH